MRFWTRVERFYKHRLLRFLEDHVGRKPLYPSDVDGRRIRRILVIRQHDQLGDLLLSTPVFRALRAHFPEAHIAAVVRAYTEEILQHHPFIDAVYTFQELLFNWTPKKALHFWKGLRARYDLTIVLNTVSHSLSSDTMADLSRAPYILGSDHLVFGGCRRNFTYNLLAPYSTEEKHQTERNLDIVRYIGVDTDDLTEVMGLTDEEIGWAEDILTRSGCHSIDCVVGIHPGAGKVGNRWPAERFARVGDALHERLGAKIVLFQGPKEQELVERVRDAMTTDCNVLAGLRLRELAAVVSRLRLFLCNDTGVLHVAAAIGTPLVAVFGPTDPAFWKPWGDKFVAVRGNDRSILSVDTSEVIRKSLALLGGSCI